jgi:hypothetical protein
MTRKIYVIKNPGVANLLIFITWYEKRSETTVSLEYLENADVFCFFIGTEMVGGFVLSANKDDFRYFSIFEGNVDSENVLRLLKRKFGIDESKALEISCVWMVKKLEPKHRETFYEIMVKETVKLVGKRGYSYVFGGSVDLAIQRFQERFLKNIFYLGAAPKQENGVLRHIDGRVVMIYFVRAEDLKMQAYKLRLALFTHNKKNLIIQWFKNIRKEISSWFYPDWSF